VSEPGITIRWQGGYEEHIPLDRQAIVIWHDQFGTVHVAGFGPLDQHPRFHMAVSTFIDMLDMVAPEEPDAARQN